MVTAWLDRINAGAEIAVLIPFCIDLRALIRAADTRAVTLQAQCQYLAYSLWSACYFAALGQWFSSLTSALWVAAYVAKVAVLLRARRSPGRR